jgi:pimeloyl-ACP methyl ester carboxylesterase
MWSGASWNRFADELGERYSLVIPDLPGHGRSTGLPEVWSTRRAASQILELLDRLGIADVRAIGSSIGAVTLLHMALQQPERVNAMVLVSGPHRLTEEARQGYRDLPLTEAPEWREWNRQHNPQGEPQIRAMLALLRGLGDNYDDFAASLDALARIPAHTLIVLGDRDHAPTIEVAQELYRTLPDASLWVVPNAGHLPFWGELPGASRRADEMFSPVVLDFFAGEDGTALGEQP